MKKVIPCVLICIFLICVFFLGKSLGSAENTTAGIEVAIPEESAEQSLRISANIDTGRLCIVALVGRYPTN